MLSDQTLLKEVQEHSNLEGTIAYVDMLGNMYRSLDTEDRDILPSNYRINFTQREIWYTTPDKPRDFLGCYKFANKGLFSESDINYLHYNQCYIKIAYHYDLDGVVAAAIMLKLFKFFSQENFNRHKVVFEELRYAKTSPIYTISASSYDKAFIVFLDFDPSSLLVDTIGKSKVKTRLIVVDHHKPQFQYELQAMELTQKKNASQVEVSYVLDHKYSTCYLMWALSQKYLKEQEEENILEIAPAMISAVDNNALNVKRYYYPSSLTEELAFNTLTDDGISLICYISHMVANFLVVYHPLIDNLLYDPTAIESMIKIGAKMRAFQIEYDKLKAAHDVHYLATFPSNMGDKEIQVESLIDGNYLTWDPFDQQSKVKIKMCHGGAYTIRLSIKSSLKNLIPTLSRYKYLNGGGHNQRGVLAIQLSCIDQMYEEVREQYKELFEEINFTYKTGELDEEKPLKFDITLYKLFQVLVIYTCALYRSGSQKEVQ